MTRDSGESSNGVDLAVAREVGAEVEVDVCEEGDGDRDDVADAEGLGFACQYYGFLGVCLRGLGVNGERK